MITAFGLAKGFLIEKVLWAFSKFLFMDIIIKKGESSMLGGKFMVKTYYNLSDLKLGMKATVSQLSHILNKYMILVYDKEGDEEGTLVFIGNKQNKEYDSWFMQEKPITPIYHTSVDLEENIVYDE